MLRTSTSLVTTALFLVGWSHAQNPRIVFSNVSVVTMEREEILAHRDVVVEVGVIRIVEEHRAKKPWVTGTVVVDGSGKYLLPGFSDMHIHTEFGDQEQLKLYLVNGVTTVLNLNGSATALEWRAKIASGEMLGPRLYTSGQIVDGDPPTNNTHVVVRNRAEAEKTVDEQVHQGYDFIKPYSALSRDAYEGVVEAAKRDHIRLVGHVPWSVGVQGTIDADQDAIAHVEELYRYFVDRHKKPPPDTQPDAAKIGTLARELKDHHIWVITTLSANADILRQATGLAEVLASPEMKFVPKFYLDDCRTGGDPYATRGKDWILQNQIMVPFLFKIVAGLRAAGVSMMAGTDATNPIQVPGISFHDELAALVEAGLSPYEALQTGTINPQIFLRQSKVAGTVTAGKTADLVMLDANPLANIANTRAIAGVMIRGRWLNHSQLETMKTELIAHFARE
jgi:amidohydrolase family protein